LQLFTLHPWYVRIKSKFNRLHSLTIPTKATATTLYYIAAHPEIASILHAEAEQVIGREGWSKASLENLVKLDSVIKESLRCSGIGAGMDSFPMFLGWEC